MEGLFPGEHATLTAGCFGDRSAVRHGHTVLPERLVWRAATKSVDDVTILGAVENSRSLELAGVLTQEVGQNGC